MQCFSRDFVEQPANTTVLSWLSENAIEATGESASSIVGDATIIGLGEATHGTRDFFTWKHEFIRALVENNELKILALEVSWTEALAVNDYVVFGRGNLLEAVAALHFWTVDTEEVIALLRWLRKHNAALTESDRVRVFGVDMQYANAGVMALLAYLRRADPKIVSTIEVGLEPLVGESIGARVSAYRKAKQPVQDAVRKALADARSAIESNKAIHVKSTSLSEWAFALQQVRLLEQAEELWASLRFDVAVDHRNRSMAENIIWLHKEFDNARVVVWAHNGHLAKEYTFANYPTGWHLARELGAKYISVGFAFGDGEFQAWDSRTKDGPKKGVHPIRVELPPKGFAERAFAKVPQARFFIDLRSSPRHGQVGDWFKRPHFLRELGGAYAGDSEMELRVLPHQYDVLAFVRSTKAAQPTPTGVRGPSK